MSPGDEIAAASLIISVVAFVLAGYAIVRANKTSSAATMVSLNEGFRSAWGRFLSSAGEEQENEFAELLNLFEIACAIRLEGSLSGNSARLMSEYLDNVLRLLVNNNYAKTHTRRLIQNATTFCFVKKFLKTKRDGVSVTVPPEWYEL